jgi:hypothetical protein
MASARNNFPPPQYNEIHLAEVALQFISLAKQSIRNDGFEECANFVWGFTSKARLENCIASHISAQKCTLGCSAEQILDGKWRSARLEKCQHVRSSLAKHDAVSQGVFFWLRCWAGISLQLFKYAFTLKNLHFLSAHKAEVRLMRLLILLFVAHSIFLHHMR